MSITSDTCVRCGGAGRYMGSWLDEKCYRDPQRLIEQAVVEAAAWNDYQEMRQMLRKDYGWFGGWRRQETKEGTR